MFRRLFLAILLLSTAAFADDALSHLRADYQNKVFLLRGFYQDSLLRYDAAGQLKHRAETGPWTTAYVLINHVDSKNGGISFKAVRVVRFFDQRKKTFRGGRTTLPVVIEVDADPANDAALRQALANVFVGDQESLIPLVPDYWRNVIERIAADGSLRPEPKPSVEPGDCGPHPTSDTPCRVGKAVKPPKITYAPDPDYNLIARTFRIGGTALFRVVVDETGHAINPVLVTPLGGGLDDKGAEVLRRWTFQPATRDGQPVPVQINVEYNFRTYN